MLTKAVKSPHLNEAKPRMSVCVRLCVCVLFMCVCVCSPSGSFRLLLMRGLTGTRVYHLPPPPPTPLLCPAKPLCHLLPLRTHTIRHSHTPSHLNLTRKTLHIRPIIQTALFLNPPTQTLRPPPPRREDLQYNHCKCPARHSINPNP